MPSRIITDNKKGLATSIIINAPVHHVWNVLTDFNSFPEWNPFIRRATGYAHVGKNVRFAFKTPLGLGMRAWGTITHVHEHQQLRWTGKIMSPLLMHVDHFFLLDQLSFSSTRLVHGEVFKGALTPVFLTTLKTEAHLAYTSMNQALKLRAEDQ